MEEEDIESLTADFARLRSSIAAELRRVGGPQEDRPATAFSSVLSEKQSALPPPPPPVVQSPARNAPPMRPPAPLQDDEVVPSFYSLRENLLGKVSSSQGALKPPPTCNVRTPSQAQREHANTVNLAVQPPQQQHPTPGGLGAGVGDSMSDEFNALRASITAQLRNAAAEGMGAAANLVPPSTAVFDDDDEYEEARPPPPRAPPVAVTAGSHQQSASVFLQRPGAAAEHGYASAPMPPQSGNTVLLSARKPSGVSGPGVITAMDPRSAIAAARSNAPGGRASGPFPSPYSIAPGGMPQTEIPDAPPQRVEISAAEVSGAPCASTHSYPSHVSREVVFGHLAFKAALESHRSHYEAKRAALPMVAQYRPKSGVSDKPPPVAAGRVSGGSGKPASRPKAPNLHTSARARPKPEAAWGDAMPENSLERLKAAAVTGSQIKADAPKKGASAKPAPKSIPITRPKSAGAVAVSRASAGGGGGGFYGGGVGNNAPLMPVTGVGVAPTLETLRSTERLVAAVAASAKEAEAGGDDDGMLGGEGFVSRPSGPQFTEGVLGQPMTAQQAWAAAAAGEARQAEIMHGMAVQTADMLRNTAGPI